MKRLVTSITAVFIFAIMVNAPMAQGDASKIYWGEVGLDKIQRADPDGGNIQDIVTGIDAPTSIALDGQAGKLYWIDAGRDEIRRSNFDGSEVETVLSIPIRLPEGMCLDVAAQKIYWIERFAGTIKRADLNGSNLEIIVTGLDTPRGIAVDPLRGKVYWTDSVIDGIFRADLDGSNQETIISTGLAAPFRIAVDSDAEKMYWADFGLGEIRRANLDGSGVEVLVAGLGRPIGIALDTAGERVYWTDIATDKVQSVGFDGGMIDDVATGLPSPQGLAFLPETSPLLHLVIDINPGSCPNSFNRNSHGVLPVALLGSDDFDVGQVDLSSITIARADGVGGWAVPSEGPPGPHSVLEDAGTPFDGELCDCHELTGDGFIDLSMKFRTTEVVAALELDALPAGDLVELTVSGNLLDGTPFEASDCVRLVSPRQPAR